MQLRFKHVFQTKAIWWSYYLDNWETIRDVVVDNMIRLFACGLQVMGWATHRCCNPTCTANPKRIHFSCKSRICPSCGTKATEQWIATQLAVLPETTWQHITFTMPCQYWQIFKYNRWLLGALSGISAKTIQKIAKKKGLTVGIFTALHTNGRDLKWYPHVHLSVTCGGITLDGESWKKLYHSGVFQGSCRLNAMQP
jgi:hypothetical protein